MTNLSLQDRFSLISLNALNSTRNSTAKKAAIRCVSAAGVLDRFLQEQKRFPKTLTNISPDWMLYLFL